MNQRTFHSRMKRNVRKNIRKHSGGVRIVAVFLATVMAFSALSANVSSIVKLLDVEAASATHIEKDYYDADFTMYDYYTDEEIVDGVPRKKGDANGGTTNHYTIFNSALIASGYSKKAGTTTRMSSPDGSGTGDLDYIPLYLGLQYNDKNNHDNENNFMQENLDTYNYSIKANCENGAGSAVAQGLVNDTLSGGYITQGTGGKVRLPYFDESFLNTPANSLASNTSSTQTLGAVFPDYKFRFVKNATTKYYEYDSRESAAMGLTRVGKVYKAGDIADGYTTYNDMASQSGFFPIRYLPGRDSQNFGYGAKFEIGFTMTPNGCAYDDSSGHLALGTSPIKFNFSGDDDVWVFIDDKLVLDLGGAHVAVNEATIDFSTKKYSITPVSGEQPVKGTQVSNYYGYAKESKSSGATKTESIADILTSLELYTNPAKKHILTVFYIERGTINSNCRISFNFQVADTVSVTNRLDTSWVGEDFKALTEQVSAKEAIAYEIQSAGGQSVTNSPDRNVTDTTVFANPNASSDTATLQFHLDTDGSINHGTMSNITASVGKTVSLPTSGSNVVFAYDDSGTTKYKYISEWKKDSASGTSMNQYTVTAADADKTVHFYAVWAESLDAQQAQVNPSGSETITIDGVNEPSLLELRKFPSNFSYDNTNSAPVTSNGKFFNGTKGDVNSIYFKVNDNQLELRNDASGNTLNMQLGKLYRLWYRLAENDIWVETMNASGLPTVPNNWGTFFSSYDGWAEKYYDLYEKLVAAKTKLETENAAGKIITTQLATYNTIRSEYYAATPDNLTTAKMDEYIGTLNDDIINATYTKETRDEYAFSTDTNSNDTTTFYVFTRDDDPPDVAIITDDIVNVDGYATVSSLSSLPSGAFEPATYPRRFYYTVTVPRCIIKSSYNKDTNDLVSTTEVPYDVQITALGGTLKSISAINSAISGGSTYYCYYDSDNDWRDITAPKIIASYSTTDYTTFWVYSEGTEPTVTYSAPNSSGKLSAGSGTKVESTVAHYYAFVVPRSYTVQIGDETNTYTCTVKISNITQDSTVYDDQTADISSLETSNTQTEAKCFYAVAEGQLGAGWYKLVTVFVSQSSGGGNRRIHAYINSVGSYPNHTNSDYNTEPEASVYAAEWGGKHFQYRYFPWDSDKTVTLQSVESSNVLGTMHESDAAYDGGVANSAYLHDVGSTGDYSNLYQYTATRKVWQYSHDAGDTASDPTSQSSGGSTPEGQFTGTQGEYADTKGVKFKLYKSGEDTDDLDAEYATRTVDNASGEFYMHTGETAKFTYQFARAYGLKIAQTGDSSQYLDTENPAVTTPPDSAKTLADKSDTGTGLYNRYSTTWVLKDTKKSYLTLNGEGANIYAKNGGTTFENNAESSYTGVSSAYTNAVGEGAISFNNIAENATAAMGVDLTVTYINTVIVGDLYIKKALDSEASGRIISYNTTTLDKVFGDEGYYDPEFTFSASFYNIFGGVNITEGEYDLGAFAGHYYVKDENGKYYRYDSVNYAFVGPYTLSYDAVNGTKVYTNDSDNSDTRNDAAMKISVSDRAMKLKFSDIYNVTDNADFSPKMIVIEGIPVQTQYLVSETLPDDSDEKPSFDAKTMVLYDVNSAGTLAKVTPDLTFVTDSGNTKIKSLSEKQIIEAALSGSTVDGSTPVLAQYYTVVSDTAADEKIVITNTINDKAYIIIGKAIDHLYYNDRYADRTLPNPTDSDNTGGLLGLGMTVGGQPIGDDSTNSDDYNGYQRATNAEQTFIFKIKETDNSTNPATVTTFYETISFDNSDLGKVTLRNTPSSENYKYRVIEAKQGCVYEITEVSDWSWKYKIDASFPKVTNKSGSSANTAVTTAGSQMVTISEFDPTEKIYNGSLYTNTAEAQFYNTKSDTRDVEGDTDIAENTATVA